MSFTSASPRRSVATASRRKDELTGYQKFRKEAFDVQEMMDKVIMIDRLFAPLSSKQDNPDSVVFKTPGGERAYTKSEWNVIRQVALERISGLSTKCRKRDAGQDKNRACHQQTAGNITQPLCRPVGLIGDLRTYLGMGAGDLYESPANVSGLFWQQVDAEGIKATVRYQLPDGSTKTSNAIRYGTDDGNGNITINTTLGQTFAEPIEYLNGMDGITAGPFQSEEHVNRTASDKTQTTFRVFGEDGYLYTSDIARLLALEDLRSNRLKKRVMDMARIGAGTGNAYQAANWSDAGFDSYIVDVLPTIPQYANVPDLVEYARLINENADYNTLVDAAARVGSSADMVPIRNFFAANLANLSEDLQNVIVGQLALEAMYFQSGKKLSEVLDKHASILDLYGGASETPADKALNGLEIWTDRMMAEINRLFNSIPNQQSTIQVAKDLAGRKEAKTRRAATTDKARQTAERAVRSLQKIRSNAAIPAGLQDVAEGRSTSGDFYCPVSPRARTRTSPRAGRAVPARTSPRGRRGAAAPRTARTARPGRTAVQRI